LRSEHGNPKCDRSISNGSNRGFLEPIRKIMEKSGAHYHNPLFICVHLCSSVVSKSLIATARAVAIS
jgi:hypothetical protein